MHILGVNEVGFESGNPGMTDGRTLPWLQDVVAQDVWTLWRAGFRDVVILDHENEFAEVYNLNENSLDLEANREALKALLRDLATP